MPRTRTDAELLRDAQAASGELGLRGLARHVLDVDERTARRWLAGESTMPGPARQLCRLLAAHPELADEIRLG